MSETKSNLPIAIGVVALLVVLGGTGYFFSKNMKKDGAEQAAQTSAPASSEATAANNAGEPAATPEEADETTKAAQAAGDFNGIPVKPGNPVVAKVDGQDITRVDVFRYIKMMPANVQQLPPTTVYPLALEQVINTRMVQNKADKAGLENDPQVTNQLALAKQQIIRGVYIQKELDKQISDADLKAKYDEAIGKQPATEEIEASHILVDDKAKAEDIIKKLEGGADFAKLAAEFSSDPGNKDKGGELGWFSKNDMVPAFSEAAFSIKPGEISKEPVETQFGWHVIKVQDKRERAKPTFEEVKPMLLTEMRREKLEGMLDQWRKTASVERYDINGDALKGGTNEVAPAAGETPQQQPAAAE